MKGSGAISALNNKVGVIGEKAMEVWLQLREYPFLRSTDLCLRSWPKDGVGHSTTSQPTATEGLPGPASQAEKVIAARGYRVHEMKEVQFMGGPMTVIVRDLTERDRARFQAQLVERIRQTDQLLSPVERGTIDGLMREAECRWIGDGVGTHNPLNWPDYIVKMPRLKFLEVKANTSKLSKGQVDFLRLATAHGIGAKLARVAVPVSLIGQVEEHLGQGLFTLRKQGAGVWKMAVEAPETKLFLEKHLGTDLTLSVTDVDWEGKGHCGH